MNNTNLYRIVFLQIFPLALMLQSACKWSSINSNSQIDKMDTIVIVHNECTECTEATIIKGAVTFPKTVNPDSLYGGGVDLILDGKSPYRGVEIGNRLYNFNIEAIGYFIRVDTANAWGKVPVFFVKKWKKLNKRTTPSNSN